MRESVLNLLRLSIMALVGLIQLELGYAESADISNEEGDGLLYDKYAKEALDLMLAKNHDI